MAGKTDQFMELKAGATVPCWLAFGMVSAILCLAASGAEIPAVTQFRKEVEPILKEYCYDCHADGAKKGDVAFDEFTSDAALLHPALWFNVLKNVRAGL